MAAGFPSLSRPLITLNKPECEAVLLAWLAELHQFASECVEILFLPRQRVLGAVRKRVFWWKSRMFMIANATSKTTSPCLRGLAQFVRSEARVGTLTQRREEGEAPGANHLVGVRR